MELMNTMSILFKGKKYTRCLSKIKIKAAHKESGKNLMTLEKTRFYANFPGFYNSNHTADRFSASRISFMHDFPETRGSQL